LHEEALAGGCMRPVAMAGNRCRARKEAVEHVQLS